MAEKGLVGLNDTLDIGRQYFNNAVSTFYDTPSDSIPKINGLLKSEYNPSGKSRIYARFNDQWEVIAYEDAVPTDVISYDNKAKLTTDSLMTGLITLTKDLTGVNAKFKSITITGDSTDAGVISQLDRVSINDLAVRKLNVSEELNVVNINEVEAEILAVKDATIKLNSEFTGPDGTETGGHMDECGVLVNRGSSYKYASVVWDENAHNWIIKIPDAEENLIKKELIGIDITDGNSLRQVDLHSSTGFVFDTASIDKEPGLFVKDEGYDAGIYYDKESRKFRVKDKNTETELIGINTIGGDRKVKLVDSYGIEVYSKNTDENRTTSGIEFIETDKDGNTQLGSGAIYYDVTTNRLYARTRSDAGDDSAFELCDVKAVNLWGESWHFTCELNAGETFIYPPVGSYMSFVDDKGNEKVRREAISVYINGLHQSPMDYVIDGINNRIVLNNAVKEASTVEVYNNTYLNEIYRLPLKSTPQIYTGVEGSYFTFATSKGAITGGFQIFAIKNNRVLIENIDFTCERLTDCSGAISLKEPLVKTDLLVVYPFLTPNIFVKNDSNLIFKTYQAAPDGVDYRASIIFDRGENLNAAGIRWNENTNNIEICASINDPTAAGQWEAITGSSTKFAQKRYEIPNDKETKEISIHNLLGENKILAGSTLNITVFKNGALQDKGVDYDYKSHNGATDYETLEFTNSLKGSVVWVYIGRAYLKSHNDLISRKKLIIADRRKDFIDFGSDFTYEPGTDTLSVFVNGVLTQNTIDYIECDEHSIKFNYNLESGTIVQVYAPSITSAFQLSKHALEFNTNANDTNLVDNNCDITVNRGNEHLPAIIRWNESLDAWCISNGNGEFRKIQTVEGPNRPRMQIYEYKATRNEATHAVDNLPWIPDKILIYRNGSPMSSANYEYHKELRYISYADGVVITGDNMMLVCFGEGEVEYVKEFRNYATTRHYVKFVDSNSETFEVKRPLKKDAEFQVFIEGVLEKSENYTIEYTDDDNKNAAEVTLTFEEPISADVDVLVMSNDCASITEGSENAISFDTYKRNYNDDSPVGNWYIKSNRGSKLKTDYIKWDEVTNEFKFNDGRPYEYPFAKVVFANSLDEFTPEKGEEVLLVNKADATMYAFYSGKWHNMTTHEVIE